MTYQQSPQKPASKFSRTTIKDKGWVVISHRMNKAGLLASITKIFIICTDTNYQVKRFSFILADMVGSL